MGNKIFDFIKYAKWLLLLVGVAMVVYMFVTIGVCKFDPKADKLQYMEYWNNSPALKMYFIWTYILMGIALCSIVFLGIALVAFNDVKKLIKIGLIVGGSAVLVLVVWAIAPGTPAIGVSKEVSSSTLKLTDTILYLSYIICGAAILMTLVSAVLDRVRK